VSRRRPARFCRAFIVIITDIEHLLAIHEYDAKLLLAYWLERAPSVSKNATVSEKFIYPSPKVAQISWDPVTGAITPDTQLPAWVHTSKLVAKPDQLIKRRGKSGLLLLNKDWQQAKEWIVARAGKEVQVSDFGVLSCRTSSFCLANRWNAIGAFPDTPSSRVQRPLKPSATLMEN